MFDPIVRTPQMPEPPAKRLFETLSTYITALREKIEREKQLELAIYYHSPAGDCIRITQIGLYESELICLRGHDTEGNASQILAHPQSVQLVLKIQKLEKETERKEIGFLASVQPEISNHDHKD